jgi:transcriptional regulator with XRE-family HTH domain
MDKSIFTSGHKRLQRLLKQVRKGAGLRQKDLAVRLGVPQPFISKYEHGDRRLDVLELREICLAMGTTLTEFVARFEQSLK